MCRLQKFIVLRFSSAHWCLWKLNQNNRKIFFGDASQSHFSYQANLPCIKHICGISRMWVTMFPKEYLTYFDKLLLSNELLDKQSKLKGEATLTWLHIHIKGPQAWTRNCLKAFGGRNRLFSGLGDTWQKAVGELWSCREPVKETVIWMK